MLFAALFMPAISVIRLGKMRQGSCLRKLTSAAIRYISATYSRIMANYAMPHNKRSDLLARLVLKAMRKTICWCGQWRDHVLAALTAQTGRGR